MLAGGTALGQALALLAAPLLTRLYTPEDFGVLGVYASLLGIFSAIASLRYEFAIPIPERDRDAAALVILSLAIIPATATGLGIGLWLFQYHIIRWTRSPGLAAYLWLIPAGVVLWGSYNVFNYWAVRRKAFPRIARTKLTQSVSMLTTQIVLFPFGAIGLLLGHLTSGAAGIGTLASLARRDDRSSFQRVGLADIRRAAWHHRRFPWYSAPAGLVNTAGVLSPLLIFSAMYGPGPAGQLALVQRVAGIPIALIGRSFAQVYLSEGASALRRSPASFRRLFLRTSGRLAILAAIPAGVLVVGGPTLFPLIFGEQWSDAGRWSRYLGCMLAIQMVASPVSQTFNLLNRQNWQLVWDVFRLFLVVLTLLTANHFSASPSQAIAVFSVTAGFSYGVLWFAQCALATNTTLDTG